MNPHTLNAFTDELLKIAASEAELAQQLAEVKAQHPGLRGSMQLGWHGYGAEDAPTRMKWRGQGLASAADRAQMGRFGKAFDTVTSLGGATKYLPVGPKSMMALGTGLMLPQVLAKEDPTGQDRSRLERTTGFAANTAGGLAGAGTMLKTRFGQKHPIIGSMIGGLGGGLAAEKLVTAPFKSHRKKKETKRRQQEQTQAMDFYPTGPVGRMAIGSGAVPPTIVGGNQ